ncbi:hypothetical protein M433DRAFT_143006 [Acidomyces richmondensis BFW]|nr:MAG: hypothetical protein FE78DRAFT_78776 [Acidomyces sp. 'richmondensis']KYG46405.1 hypothetical protein M433DRAFT_143006 [Acidomyces richmondensis BFW]
MASFLIKDVRVFDGEYEIEKASVLIKNGKITKVSSNPYLSTAPLLPSPATRCYPILSIATSNATVDRQWLSLRHSDLGSGHFAT